MKMEEEDEERIHITQTITEDSVTGTIPRRCWIEMGIEKRWMRKGRKRRRENEDDHIRLCHRYETEAVLDTNGEGKAAARND